MKNQINTGLLGRLAPRALLIGLLPFILTGEIGAQTAKTTKYTYDALGRLTFVEDGANGNRDYDYDKLGNRLLVSAGTADDAAASPPSIAAPGGRSKNYVANCGWKATWTLVSGAYTYTLKNTLNQSYTVTPGVTPGSGPSYIVNGNTIDVYLNCPYNDPSANEPGSVRACSVDGCSSYASF